MQYIVMVQRAEEARPTFHGPFSSFEQACEWAKVSPDAHEVETTGIDISPFRHVTIRPLYKP